MVLDLGLRFGIMHFYVYVFETMFDVIRKLISSSMSV